MIYFFVSFICLISGVLKFTTSTHNFLKMIFLGKTGPGVRPIASVTGRPSLAPGRTKSTAGIKNDPVSRRQTTTALNDRTNTSR